MTRRVVNAWHDANTARERFLSQVRSEFLISISEQRIMWSLLTGPRSLGELVELTGYGKGTISTASRNLLDRGLLDRVVDPDRSIRFRLTTDATERIMEMHGGILRFAGMLALDAERADSLVDMHERIAGEYAAATVELQRRPMLASLRDGLRRGDALRVESLLKQSIGDAGELDDVYVLVEEAYMSIVDEPDDPTRLTIERTVAVALRALDHIHQITRPSRSNGLFAGSIRPTIARYRLCSHIASQILERSGWTVVPFEVLDTDAPVDERLQGIELPLLVVAAPNQRFAGAITRTVDTILATGGSDDRRIAIVGPERDHFIDHSWGNRVVVAGPSELRQLASDLTAGRPASG